MTPCDYCTNPGTYRLYHRDGTESVRCDKCQNPVGVHSISKLGLEFKNQNTIKVQINDESI